MKTKKINTEFDKEIIKNVPDDLVKPVFSSNSLEIISKRGLILYNSI